MKAPSPLRAAAWRLAVALLIVGIGGCVSPVWLPSAPVPVEGASAELAGIWRGTYESRDTGRFGDVVFALSADADSAVGEVVMVPRGRTVTVLQDGDRWRWTGATRPEVLTVRFVRFRGGTLRGALDPYRDPDCGCELETTFDGEIEGDTIRGRFETRASGDHDAEGTWEVTRRSP